VSVRHTLWIGGAPASGKTTVATRIARRHGLRLYSADTRTWEHRDRALAAGNAAARRWEAMTPQQPRLSSSAPSSPPADPRDDCVVDLAQ
jgi:cytidylate kinase